MFEIDKRRIEACLQYKDHFCALEYALFVKDKYLNKEREFFEKIIESIKKGEYC